jgi:hypothetical protein
LTGATVTLTWSGANGATSYGLGLRDIASGTLVVNTTVSGTSYVASVSPGKQYRWNVNACNATGCSSYTDLLYFQMATPSPPSGVAVLDQSFSPDLGGSNFPYGTGSSTLAQTFTVGITGLLSEVDVTLSSVVSTNVPLEIRRTSGGVPTSQVLIATTVSVTAAQPVFSWSLFRADLSASGLRVNAGDVLAIVLPGVSNSLQVSWAGKIGADATYPGGRNFFNGTAVGGDFVFRTFVSN